MAAVGADVQERELHSSATDQALMTAITKAEFDAAVVTAHAHRRSVKRFLDECMELATLNEQIADDCIYALPRKEGGETKMIEGPSARMAEIVAHAWGNCRIGARVVDEGREFVTAQGVFQDLEKNVHITYEVRRRITNKYGHRYSADMIGVTGNAACSIALRNAVFKGVPKAFWNPVYEAARKVVAGDAKTLVNRRSEALAFLQKQGATKEMVLATLGVGGVEDITLEHLVQLRGLASSIKEGEITVEEAFKPKDTEQHPATRAAAALGALRGGKSNGKGEEPKPNGQDKPNGSEKPPETSKPAETARPAEKRKDPEQIDIGGKIPQYDAATAIKAIREIKTLQEYGKRYTEIVEDFVSTGRKVPEEVENAAADWKAKLESEV